MNIEETSFGDAIRLAGDKLFHFHSSDSHRGTPGEGMLRWQEVAAALKEINYQGYVVIESFDYTSRFGPVVHFWRPLTESPETLARNGLAFMKALLQGC
jgi:D-psicose/D-tagatose/L-ribulose 3-epimerase